MRPIQKAFSKAGVVRRVWQEYVKDFLDGCQDPEMKRILSEIAINILSEMGDSNIKELASMLLKAAETECEIEELKAILKM